MTEQITVPKQTWDALQGALENSLQSMVQVVKFRETGRGRPPEQTCTDAIAEASAALTAANAASHQKPETPTQPTNLRMQSLEIDGTDYLIPVDVAYEILWMRFEINKVNAELESLKSVAHASLSTIPAGYKLVPLIPTEQQWGGLARDMMMWLAMDGRKTAGSLFNFLEDYDTPIPQWLRDEPEMKNWDHVPSKGTRVTIIYRAMLEAAPGANQ